ncbi:outer membrane protein assembly factor BamB family protein [Pedobacter insulae]|uniref:Outer membrane protein assembly factor BamB, contains PQQ-like beta-propeller repeat n=1 Tax=Pedobacter insulae TaxID=414048 RepID=A0A1I2XJ71_9SPHI|nr:PQQ-binding-like beta-propeller repeat protein [Pedobacter insulae]SFH13544.1 Outer membrane protein assembly factor BamB, contains PQQ-like beta-propeller repeat [Pedobacter insulae]
MNRKLIILSLLFVTCSVIAKAQSKKTGNFKTVWESEFSNKANVISMINQEGTFILGTDGNSATVLNGDGKQIWEGDYKKITTNKTNSSEFQYYIRNKDGGYLFLFDSRKLGTDRIAVIDVKSGKEMWNSENYQNLLAKGGGPVETVNYINELDAFMIAQKDGLNMVNAKTGEKIWETKLFKGSIGKYVYNKSKNEIVMINYKPTALAALFSGFKNQLVKINAANGEILWDATFRGTIEKKLITREALVNLDVRGDKVFLWLDGLQCFNADNGQKIWEVDYENDMSKSSSLLGNKNQKGIYGTLADPIFTNDAVYIVIFANRSRTKYVEKHDLATGKLLWASEKIAGAFSMPNVYRTNDRVMVQVGGKVEVQEIVTRRTTSGTETQYKIYTDHMAQKNGILSLDDKTGQTVWRSEKFDKRITDMIIHEGKTVFVGDGDQFYSYDISSGKQLFDVKHNDARVGKATDVIDFNENVVVLSEKGLASYKKADGKRVYATDKLPDVDFFYEIGGNYFLRNQKNSKNVIYGVDMTNGDIKGKVESKGKGGSDRYGDGIDITENGEFIFAFKGKKVEKIKVNN